MAELEDTEIKGVEDVMTRLGYFDDDNRLFVETVERWHGELPGVLVQLTGEDGP